MEVAAARAAAASAGSRISTPPAFPRSSPPKSRASTSRLRRRSRAVRVRRAQHPLRHRRGDAGGAGFRHARTATSIPRGSASTSAPAKGSRTFTLFMKLIAEAQTGRRTRPGAVHPRRPASSSIPQFGDGAGAEHAGRPPGQPVQCPGPEPQLPDGLRRLAARRSAKRPRSSAAATPTSCSPAARTA